MSASCTCRAALEVLQHGKQGLTSRCLQVYAAFRDAFVPKLKIAVERELKHSKGAGEACSEQLLVRGSHVWSVWLGPHHGPTSTQVLEKKSLQRRALKFSPDRMTPRVLVLPCEEWRGCRCCWECGHRGAGGGGW